ncbi:MAG: acryloyl-CoA reductase [Xanthomonadaceae bacterium]|nr:acryloyl-CoA reductase [Xanthomonadaceae bacterium]MDE2083859.1 acryloyl-CoA reductase [Xanthomonadaceae bacterium]MDE2258562.1 acryloyl-CoA reductase [Xanthomonadaceae bacterium]
MDTTFSAFRIHAEEKPYRAGIETMRADDLSSGEVLVKVAYSSVNYKDALAGTGRGKILREPVLNGGIDVAGYVAASSDPKFREGDQVLCTGCGLSETRDGGYAQYARLQSKWTIPLPAGLTLRESMVIGTAGFTAALSLYQMQRNGQTPEMGPIVITGATGGVGSLAIDILSRAGFETHAISGKLDRFDDLIALGAKQCLSRKDLYWGRRPLETAHWAGAIDNVGGDLLSGLTRVIKPYGNIASCGLAAAPELQTTVMPFIIRGVSLLGIASAGTARAIRDEIWAHLGADWKPAHLDRIATREVGLDGLPEVFDIMLAGDSFGRTVVKL